MCIRDRFRRDLLHRAIWSVFLFPVQGNECRTTDKQHGAPWLPEDRSVESASKAAHSIPIRTLRCGLSRLLFRALPCPSPIVFHAVNAPGNAGNCASSRDPRDGWCGFTIQLFLARPVQGAVFLRRRNSMAAVSRYRHCVTAAAGALCSLCLLYTSRCV